MNFPFSVRTKLIVAAVSLLVLSGFGLICNLGPFSGTIVFKIGAFLLAGIIVVQGIFLRAQLQLFWGWAMAFYTVFGLVLLGCGLPGGPDLHWFPPSILTAGVGAYLLLVDDAVKEYRKSIR